MYSIPGRAAGSKPTSIPGPGAYDISSSPGKGPGAVIAGRHDDGVASDTPGPGSYEPRLPPGPAFSMVGRDPDRISGDTPGDTSVTFLSQ
jgi:hypothetical protein